MPDICRIGRFLLVVLGLFLPACPAGAEKLYFIDAHSQIQENFPDLELVIKRMDAANVRRTILSARTHKTDAAHILGLAARYPDRIIPAIRTKGREFRRGSGRYYADLKAAVESGRYRALAEVLVYHAQKGKKAREIAADLSEKKVRVALGYALAKSWPFIIHIEFGSLSGAEKKRYRTALKKLLAEFPEHPFGLSHLGQLGPAEARELIAAHPNVFLQTSHACPVTTSRSRQPWTELFDGYSFRPEWKGLMTEYPKNFVFTLDNVWTGHWQRDYLPTMEYWTRALAELDPTVAARIAHGNAERLWKPK